MDRVMITMPDSLRRRLDEASAAVAENRSQFVRQAIEQRIEQLRQQAFDLLLAEGYASAGADPASAVLNFLEVQDQAAGQAWTWDD